VLLSLLVLKMFLMVTFICIHLLLLEGLQVWMGWESASITASVPFLASSSSPLPHTVILLNLWMEHNAISTSSQGFIWPLIPCVQYICRITIVVCPLCDYILRYCMSVWYALMYED
jgi:hypothetical protein